MTRLSRLVGIILHLQGNRVVRAEDIADYFGVSVRTIYRDLRALEDSGLPIAAEAGKGYSLVEGYHLPPVMFTQEEASALLIGGALAEQLSDQSLRPHVHSALMKINGVLPEEQKEFVERLSQRTAIHLRRMFSSEEDKANLTTVQEGVAKRRLVHITYHSRNRDETTERDVEPLGIVYYADNWHMLGYCRLRKGIRDFRADRIQSMKLLDETFPERKDFILDKHMELFFTGGGPSYTITLLFSREIARYVTDRDRLGFVEEVETEEGILMYFEFPDLNQVARWLIQYGNGVKIIEPEELKQKTVTLAKKVLELHED